MTTDMSWLRSWPGRCPACLMHIETQGHRASADGKPTGCTPSGPVGLMLASGRMEGDVRKQEAFTALDANDNNGELRRICSEIVALGRRQRDFTPDDLPAAVREQTNPNRRGRAFSALIDNGTIREVDRVKSANPKAHGKKVGVYRLVAA